MYICFSFDLFIDTLLNSESLSKRGPIIKIIIKTIMPKIVKNILINLPIYTQYKYLCNP